MKFVIGKKLQMTQIFDEEGVVHPVTVIGLEPLKVSMIRNTERDGYESVQVGYREKKEKFNKHKEFRGSSEGFEDGMTINPTDVFSIGDVVKVSAISKGKGFAGVVKRHGFAGGPRTHGQKHTERSPGSIGAGLRTRVPKGMKMAGRMGGNRVTIKNTQVVLVDKENSLILLRGSVPGRRGTEVEIQSV